MAKNIRKAGKSVMKAKEIYKAVDQIAPFTVHASYDNPGFLVGDGEEDVNFALVSLDITPRVIEEAHMIGAQMIISHHPVIFRPLKNIHPENPVYGLLRRGISAICAHTNLDCAKDGVNDTLIRLAGVEGDTEILYDGEGLPIGRIGELARATDIHNFAIKVKHALTANCVRYADAEKAVKKIAVIGGAGADEIEKAIEAGADTFVTGDVKYHQFLDAGNLGINLIDAGHFATENPVVKVLCDKLSEALPEVRFEVSSVHGDCILTV